MNNIREQKKQTKAFIKRWENRGNERQDITSEIKTSNKSKNAIKRNIRSNSFQAEVAKSDYQTEDKEYYDDYINIVPKLEILSPM